MTHRERILAAFRFQPTDHLPCDLMEGVVWPELIDYFRAAHSIESPDAILSFLDPDVRWTFMQYVNPSPTEAPSDEPAPAPPPADHPTYSLRVAHGPLAEQVALARAHGLLVLYPSFGAVRPVLGDLIDIGVNGMLVFQTTATGMDLEAIARDFGGRVLFYGGMDIQHLLSFGTVEDVVCEVDRNARAFEDCGGYIVANSHHCVATIRGELIEAMFIAAHKR
jgi:uroporphyrinogen-III decarboxylase